MANSLTNYGQEIALSSDINGTNTGNGGLTQLAAKIKLYASTSTPAKDGTGFDEVANGNGYVTGGQAVAGVDWTLSVLSGNAQIQLADKVWTASGGTIANIAGAYLTDSGDSVMGWWERTTPLTLNDGDSITADDLTIRIV